MEEISKCELVEKISEIKRALVDFDDMCISCIELKENERHEISRLKEYAYYLLVDIKNISQEE